MLSEPKIILVADELNLIEKIKEILTQNGYSISGILDKTENACAIIELENPDLVLLDLNLKGSKSGIDLAEELRHTFNLPIVFLSSYSGRVLMNKIKHILPEGIVTKPITTEGLITSIEFAIQLFKASRLGESVLFQSSRIKAEDIFIRENGWLKRVLVKNIDWIKAEGVYTHIFAGSKQYTLRNTVKELLEKLPEDQFVRVHKSFIINMEKIEALSSNSVKIENGEIPVGRNYYPLLLKYINKLSN